MDILIGAKNQDKVTEMAIKEILEANIN